MLWVLGGSPFDKATFPGELLNPTVTQVKRPSRCQAMFEAKRLDDPNEGWLQNYGGQWRTFGGLGSEVLLSECKAGTKLV